MIMDENLRIRANLLEDKNLNGLDFIKVNVIDNTTTELDVYFINTYKLDEILNFDQSKHSELFLISGGERIIAGPLNNQVHVTKIRSRPNQFALRMIINPTGDYSVYVLSVGDEFSQFFDPIFSEIPFKMRPGCYNSTCFQKPEIEQLPNDPNINYMAKDYESFKHLMISAMIERVPGWEPTSEADLDMVLLELICTEADKLSDFQDRVMNEAYLETAKKRVSIARHARLMNYHISQGNQSSSMLALIVRNDKEFSLLPGFEVRIKQNVNNPKRIVFSTKRPFSMHELLNKFVLYTWSDTNTVLKAGSTYADLQIDYINPITLKGINDGDISEGELYLLVQEFFLDNDITQILIQEKNITSEGIELSGGMTKRQILNIDCKEVEYGQDPLTEKFYLRVYWKQDEKLEQNYDFTPINDVIPVSFYANLAEVYHGESKIVYFYSPDYYSSALDDYLKYRYDITNWGIVCRLPHSPLSFENTYNGETPNGKYPPKSTLEVTIQEKEDDSGVLWEEQIDFIHSEELDKHFIVETDENQKSLVRFGNGINGMRLPENSIVKCKYQVGIGNTGNIGADMLTVIGEGSADTFYLSRIDYCWNPLEIRNAREPESIDVVIRKAPEAYNIDQLRGITVNDQVDDYEKRTQEIEDVYRAHARYEWMGSWRLVEISIDPVGDITHSAEMFDKLKLRVLNWLNSVKLIGDEVVIKKAKYVPLEIRVTVCIDRDFWIIDIKDQLEAEFTEKFTPDGRRGFFHSDLWTFGQTLRKSQLIGKIQSFEGVDRVIDSDENPIKIKRLMNEDVEEQKGELVIHPYEIIQVKNDPMQLEKGYIFFDFKGGR